VVTEIHLEGQLELADEYREIIMGTCGKHCLKPSIIAAIISRESQWGIALHPPGPAGTGDFAERKNRKPWRPGPKPPDGKGFGRGLMQVDFDSHEFARKGNWWDPLQNIDYGCGVLSDMIKYLGPRIIENGEKLLRAAIAAYNCGPGNVRKAVRSGFDVDFYTTGKNYSKDILERADFFKAKGWT
jgi:hypothetical protein